MSALSFLRSLHIRSVPVNQIAKWSNGFYQGGVLRGAKREQFYVSFMLLCNLSQYALKVMREYRRI